MHGNVWEWCADPWHESYTNAPTDGRTWSFLRVASSTSKNDQDNNLRVIRGGSWSNIPSICRAAFRNYWERDRNLMRKGFRLALSRPHHFQPSELATGNRS
jgi:formylglycine-generating enzyme required for sulfatase activity